eukprot:SAG11_NODE_9047_length_949_cov_1.864706_1_plen_95_part_00
MCWCGGAAGHNQGRSGIKALPHPEFWLNLYGLTVDGWNFTFFASKGDPAVYQPLVAPPPPVSGRRPPVTPARLAHSRPPAVHTEGLGARLHSRR